MKNKNFATSPAAEEMPVKPKIPATIEIIKKITAHFNMITS
jgi:hypothetical protein